YAAGDIVYNIFTEMVRSHIEYPKKLRAQIRGIVSANTKYAEIGCPVVIIQGALDPVSDIEKTLPSEHGRRSQDSDVPKGTLERRGESLRDAFFTSAPSVDMLVAERHGHHGFP